MQLVKDNIDFAQYMKDTESHNVRSASNWIDATVALFHPKGDAPRAPTMLWEKTKEKIAFRPGEVTLWAGINGHGKSMFTSQVALDLTYQAERVMIASFEMQPPRTMHRMTRQAWGARLPDENEIKVFGQWTDERLWIYDHVGAVEWRKVIAVMRYALREFGVKQFFIDSLMKCVKGDDDYNGQKDFVAELCAFAQANGAHVHLIHHVRKGESEHKAPGKFDVKGAGAITDQVDNVIIVWKSKEAIEKNNGDPTCVLLVEKQRNGEYEGKLGFWFDSESQQYMESFGAQPAMYGIDTRRPGGTKGYASKVRYDWADA
jgi:twinkle protein